MSNQNITDAIFQIATVYPILPITINPEVEQIAFMPKHKELWWPQWLEQDANGCIIGDRVSVNNAINQERIGRPLNRFDEFYLGESDDYLAPAIEHFDGIWGMSYHDAINQSNVY